MSALLDMLIRQESTVRNAHGQHALYRDTSPALGFEGKPGKVTIGWGHNVDDNGMSDTVAAFQLEEDIAHTQAELRRTFPWFSILDPVRQDAVTSMYFNLGMTKFLGFHKMIKALADGDTTEASVQALNSAAAQEAPTRYKEIAEMLETGQYQA